MIKIKWCLVYKNNKLEKYLFVHFIVLFNEVKNYNKFVVFNVLLLFKKHKFKQNSVL